MKPREGEARWGEVGLDGAVSERASVEREEKEKEKEKGEIRKCKMFLAELSYLFGDLFAWFIAPSFV